MLIPDVAGLMIGITGATGCVGNRTARYVADRQTPVPLIVRAPTRAPDLKADVRAPSSYGTGDEMRAAREASGLLAGARGSVDYTLALLGYNNHNPYSVTSAATVALRPAA